MNHQVQDLTSFCLKLEGFYVSCHSMSVAGSFCGFKMGGLRERRTDRVPRQRMPEGRRDFVAASTKLMDKA
jgi:hypothetical protein